MFMSRLLCFCIIASLLALLIHFQLLMHVHINVCLFCAIISLVISLIIFY